MLVELQVMIIRFKGKNKPNYCEMSLGGKYIDTLSEDQAKSTIEAFGLKIDPSETVQIVDREFVIYK